MYKIQVDLNKGKLVMHRDSRKMKKSKLTAK